MSVQATITYVGLAAHMTRKGNLKRTIRKVIDGSLVSTARKHRRRFLPLHFTQGAGGRYGFTKRDPQYNRRKRKRYGHTKDLVLTGTSAAMILGNKSKPVAKKRAGLLGAEYPIKGPKYFYQYNKTGRIVRKFDEVREITTGEATILAIDMSKGMTKRMNRLPGRKTRRVV